MDVSKYQNIKTQNAETFPHENLYKKRKLITDDVMKICDKFLKNEPWSSCDLEKVLRHICVIELKHKIKFCNKLFEKLELSESINGPEENNICFHVYISFDAIEAIAVVVALENLFKTIILMSKSCFTINQDKISAVEDDLIVLQLQDSFATKNNSMVSLLIALAVEFKQSGKLKSIRSLKDCAETVIKSVSNKSSEMQKEMIYSIFKETYVSKANSDIDNLSKIGEFKIAFQNFIASLPNLNDALPYFEYGKLSHEIVHAKVDENFQLNPNESTLNNISKLTIKLKYQDIEKVKKLSNIDILVKYPKEMEKITRFLLILKTAKVDENFHHVLNMFCCKMDVNSELLRSFASYQLNIDNEKTIESNNVDFISSMTDQSRELVTKTILNSSQSFSDELKSEKTFSCYLTEITEMTNLNTELLKQKYLTVNYFFKTWQNKSANDIYKWAVEHKGSLIRESVLEAIAIMARMFQLASGGKKLNIPQLLSIILFVDFNEKKYLCEVATGEGKTIIIAVISAIKALQGKVVDVVTSNPILAEEAITSFELKNFYALLNITVATNNENSLKPYNGGEKICYKSDIVFGTIGNFQFDYLRDKFIGQQTRGDRPFEIIILDEVDNMLIDNAQHIAKLSENFPGMECLKYSYIKVWQQLTKAEKRVIENMQMLLKTKAKMLSEMLSAQLKTENECNDSYEKYMIDLKNKFFDNVKSQMRDDVDINNKFMLPHIQKYAIRTKEKWIESAINAKYFFNINEQYIIGKDKNGALCIQPVDHVNTGVTMTNTVWQYGLHQFLQLKHNLRLTNENMTSCFISNMGYIKMYDHISGLSGTLGSNSEREFLSFCYSVETAKIPTYRPKRFKQLSTEVTDDELFIKDIVTVALNLVRIEKRAVLIICETIKDADEIFQILKLKHDSVQLFKDESSSFNSTVPLQLGDIVVATNIAGRGTNFQTSSALETNGGLHVCVTFLPRNKRVEEQAFGRTSRQGKSGDAKLLVRKSEFDGFLEISDDTYLVEKITEMRDIEENKSLERLKKFKVPELAFYDAMFKRFCNLYSELKMKETFTRSTSFFVDDLKEFWAFWLDGQNYKGDEIINKSEDEEFAKFTHAAEQIIAGQIMFNPHYCVKQSELLIHQEKYDEAEKIIQHAFSLCDSKLIYGAHMKLYEIAMSRGNMLLDKLVSTLTTLATFTTVQSDREYKSKAKYHLKNAKSHIAIEIEYLDILINGKQISESEDETLDNMLESEDFCAILEFQNGSQDQNDLVKHLFSRQQALIFYKNHIESLEKQIDESNAGLEIINRNIDYFIRAKEPEDNENGKIDAFIKKAAFEELGQVGLNVIYSVREVHDVPPEKLAAAIAQIDAGLALILSGIAFPIMLPASVPIAGFLVTEGIFDIIFELIHTNSDKSLNWKEYLKAKFYSAAISLLTAGISALLKMPALLNRAKRLFRFMADWLRRCTNPYFLDICEKIASRFDKIADYFEKLETIARYNQMSKALKYEYLKNLKNKGNTFKEVQYLGKRIVDLDVLKAELKFFGKFQQMSRLENTIFLLKEFSTSTVMKVRNRIVMNQIMQRVVAPSVSSVMKSLKPLVAKHVGKAIMDFNFKNKLDNVSYDTIRKLIRDINNSFDIKMIRNIFKDSITGIMKCCNNWMIQLAGILLDQSVKAYEMITHTNDICTRLTTILSSSTYDVPLIKNSADNADQIKRQLSNDLSEEIFNRIVNSTIELGMDTFNMINTAIREQRKQKEKQKVFNNHLKRLETGAPAGIEEAHALSDLKKRPIHILKENGDVEIIGAQHGGDPIKVRYFKGEDPSKVGHYVPLGKDDNWTSPASGKNNCLFDAVAFETGDDAGKLRTDTIDVMSKNPDQYIAPYAQLYFGSSFLLTGGAVRERTNLNTTFDFDIPLTLDDLNGILDDFLPSETVGSRPIDGKTIYDAEVRHLTKRLIYLPYILGLAKRAQELYGRFPLIRGGSTHQDRTSGEGRDVHASHLIRAAVDTGFEAINRDLYNILAKLTSVTENQWSNINGTGTIGGAIDRLSERYINIVRNWSDPSANIGWALMDDYNELNFGDRTSYLGVLRNVNMEEIERAYQAGYNLI